MHNFRIISLLIYFCVYGFLTVRGSVDSKSGDTTKVVILSLNDQHAKIDNYGYLKHIVDSIRNENPYVILLSAGDNFTGNPVVDQYKEKGYPIIDLMNDVGFNATAVGNHEFDYGQATLHKLTKQANFPFLSANIKDSTDKNVFVPYTILTLDNGIRISVVSAIQLGIGYLPDSHPSNLLGLRFSDGVNAIKSYSYLKDSSEIVIALTHLGFEKDIELADSTDFIDIIFGGHTHTLTKPAHVQKHTYIMQSGSNVRNIAKAEINLVNGKITRIAPSIISISSKGKTDYKIEEKIAIYNDNDQLNRVIGFSKKPIVGVDELGSLMTDAIIFLEDIDIAFQNNGGIRVDRWNEGAITIKDIYKLDPFGNEIIVFKLTIPEIKSLILNSFIKNENKPDLQASGIKYTVIVDSNNNPIDIEITGSNNKRLSSKRRYNVAMNSYIASAYKFDHKDAGKSRYSITAQALIDYIMFKKEIDYSGVKRVFVKTTKN